MLTINFHRPTEAKAWIPEHRTHGALEVIDQDGSKVTIFVDPSDKGLLQQIIAEAAKLIVSLEEPEV